MRLSEIELSRYNFKLKSKSRQHENYQNQILGRLVELTFHPIWQWLIEVVIVISIFNAAYVVFFTSDVSNLFLYYSMEAIFLYDTLIAYIHRFRLRMFSLNPPRDRIILLIDTLSLLPIYECCYIIFPQWATPAFHRKQQLKSILRVPHLVAIVFLERFLSISMNIAIMKLTHVFLLILMNLLLACSWSYEARCWPNCRDPNWSDSLRYLTNLELDDPMTWFLTCFTTIGDMLIHGSPGFLIDRNDTEAFIILSAMIIGFTMHSFFEVAHTFNNYVNLLEPRYAYKLHLSRVHDLFDSCGNDEKSQKLKLRTLRYYNMLWVKRKGIVAQEKLIHELPTIFVKEIMVDVFHEAMIHSHLFADFTFQLKRELCACMQTEYYVPGDYLFLPDATYARMLYLHSGVISVISHEDYQTPILTLSSGTLLCEASLCMARVSTTMVQCATECEIKTLPMTSYHRMALRYRDCFATVRGKIEKRIAYARMRIAAKTASERNVARCKLLKKQWRCVADMHAHAIKQDGLTKRMWAELVKGFNSKYLDMIVLAESVAPDRKIICLNANCPYVINPNSSFRKFFVYFHLVAVFLHALYLPYFYIFMENIPKSVVLANVTLDLVFFLDIYMQSISLINDDGVEIVDAKKVIIYKLKTFPFLFDLFCTVPYDYVGALTAISKSTYFFLRLPKIMQWYKVLVMIIKLEDKFINRSLLLIFTKYFVIYFSAFYISTCYHYYFFNFGQNGPVPAQGDWPVTKYPILSCVLYNLNAICLLGLSETMATTLHGMIAYSLLTFLGCYLLNFCLVELSCHIVKNNECKYNYLKQYHNVYDFIMTNSLAVKFNKYFNAYYRFLWQFNHNIRVKPGVEMPEFDIYIENVVKSLRHVPAFSNFSEKLLELLAARAAVHVHPPGFELCCVDERHIHMHIIAKGYCSMALFMAGDKEAKKEKTLKPGDCFNIVEVLHHINSFNTIKTLTAVEEITLSAKDFWKVLESDQNEKKNFEEALRWHHHKYGTLFNAEKTSDFLIHEMEKKKALEQVPYFRYVIDDNYDFGAGESERKKLRKRLGVLYYFMFKNTIDPLHKYYIGWELFRSFVAISFGFTTFLNVTVLKAYPYSRAMMFVITELVFLADFYLRFHLQYHNEEKIKVTYLYSTIEHYVKTSMVLDIIVLFPLLHWPFYIGGAYAFVINCIIAVIYYVALFHRPVQGLMYIEDNYNDIRKHLAIILRNLIITVCVVAVVGNNMLLAVCNYDEKNGYDCTSTPNYISTSPFAEDTDTFHLLIFHLHAVSERIHSDIVGVSEYPLMNNIIESLVINMLLWCFKLYLMSKMISSTIAGNAVILNKTKTQFTNFISFVRHETISDTIVEEVKEHFEHVTCKYGGLAVNNLLSKLSDKVRLDIKQVLFMSTLHKTPFFRLYNHLQLREYIDSFDLCYYKIGADIIRCNDVQSNIYVVSKGSVDIIVAADTLITLKCGGAFGCFVEKGITRQTILAQAKTHVELLVIDSALFFHHLGVFPGILEKFRSMMKMHMEYIKVTDPNVQYSSVRPRSRRLLGINMVCLKIYDRFNHYIQVQSKHYKLYTLAVIHVAAVSSILQIFLAFLETFWILVLYSYLADTFFWINIVIMFHMQYIDPETGIRITSPHLIRKRYAKSLKFWVTFLGSLPIEIIAFCARADTFVVKCCFANRLLRFFLAMIYNQELNKKLSFSKWFQWMYIIYLLTFQLGLMSLIWYMIACQFETCMHRVSTGPTKKMDVAGDRNQIMLSLLYVVILFTASGVRTVSSATINQITVTLLISNASLVITSLMIGVLASLLLIKDITANHYKSKVERMKLYFSSLHLSPYLRGRIYESMVVLWMRRRGELLPKIIHDAPKYIEEDIMFSLYGTHFVTHELFRKLHLDFIRQLCVHLKVGLYTPDQLIVSKGDRDGCMYFLHRGQIRVMGDDDELGYVVVGKNYTFGEEQGIYDIPHKRTYIAYTTIDLLILEKSSWEFLLKWFPASNEIISLMRDAYTVAIQVDNDEADIIVVD